MGKLKNGIECYMKGRAVERAVNLLEDYLENWSEHEFTWSHIEAFRVLKSRGIHTVLRERFHRKCRAAAHLC